MVLNVNRYRGAKAALVRFFHSMREPDIQRRISLIAITTHTPIIAVAVFVGEDIGFTPELNLMIERLVNDYKITELIK